ncbi:hypothetical protein ACI1UB_06260 [Lactococcus petauri]|uniref:hypothetical protein n=1 Tax=Lactococcus petauri TaxID=1940789 RepID=UPI00385541F0
MIWLRLSAISVLVNDNCVASNKVAESANISLVSHLIALTSEKFSYITPSSPL